MFVFDKIANSLSDLFDQFFSQDIEMLGWCAVGSVLSHAEKVPL